MSNQQNKKSNKSAANLKQNFFNKSKNQIDNEIESNLVNSYQYQGFNSHGGKRVEYPINGLTQFNSHMLSFDFEDSFKDLSEDDIEEMDENFVDNRSSCSIEIYFHNKKTPFIEDFREFEEEKKEKVGQKSNQVKFCKEDLFMTSDEEFEDDF